MIISTLIFEKLFLLIAMKRLSVFFLLIPVFILHVHCNSSESTSQAHEDAQDSGSTGSIIFTGDAGIVGEEPLPFYDSIKTGDTKPAELIAFAKTLIDVPYKYGSIDPSDGLDCSGFITYIFNHFDIAVPRSSVGFTNMGRTIDLQNAKPGDLILFTGTDSSIRVVGHMGLVVSNNNGLLEFIHSTSGKAYGVVITPLEKYYMGRFEKVIRIFPEKML